MPTINNSGSNSNEASANTMAVGGQAIFSDDTPRRVANYTEFDEKWSKVQITHIDSVKSIFNQNNNNNQQRGFEKESSSQQNNAQHQLEQDRQVLLSPDSSIENIRGPVDAPEMIF